MNNNLLLDNPNIVFMGTPGFAVPILESLVNESYNIKCVYTQSGKAAGRGMRSKDSPVYEIANKNKLCVRTPEKLNDDDYYFLEKQNLDIIIVAAYGLILPERFLSIPRYGCINVHASLLPKWRGAAPIQRSIMAGDKKTGISFMLMKKGLDTGPILCTEEIQIADNDNFMTIHDTLSIKAAKTINLTIQNYILGKLIAKEQDHSNASYADKIKKNDTKIDWSLDAIKIKNLINSVSPLPCAWTLTKDNKRLKILSASIVNIEGKIGVLSKDNLLGCGSKSLNIDKVQPEGKKIMKFDDYLRGRNFLSGEKIFI